MVDAGLASEDSERRVRACISLAELTVCSGLEARLYGGEASTLYGGEAYSVEDGDFLSD